MRFSDPSGTETALDKFARSNKDIYGREGPESGSLADLAAKPPPVAVAQQQEKKAAPAKSTRTADRELTNEELGAELDRIARELGIDLTNDDIDRHFEGATPDAATSSSEEDSPTVVDRLRQNAAGPGALTTAESAIRSRYLEVIKNNSDEAVGQIDEIIEAVRSGALTEEQGLAQAEAAARKVSEGRNAVRTSTQQKLGPGGRILSETIEGTPPSFEARVADKGGKNLKGFREVAKSAGKSNPGVTALAKVGKVAGPVGLAVGGALAVDAVLDAPEGEKVDVAVEEGAAFGAGIVGSSLGTAGAVLALGAVVAAPALPVIIAVGILGGIAGGLLFSEGARAGVRRAQGR